MKKSEFLGVKVSPAMRDALDRRAEAENRGYAEILRTALVDYLCNLPPGPNGHLVLGRLGDMPRREDLL